MPKNTKVYTNPEQLSRSIEKVLNTQDVLGVFCVTDTPDNFITVCAGSFSLGAIGIRYTDRGWIPCVFDGAEMLVSFGCRGRQRFFEALGLEGEVSQ